jgi:hypothetical protein
MVNKRDVLRCKRCVLINKRHEIGCKRGVLGCKRREIPVSRREIRISSRKFPDFLGKTGIILKTVCQMCAIRRMSAKDTNITNQHEFNSR